jgi:acyl-CoA thioester hydrolase
MAKFRFYTDISIRFGDLDVFGHLNNARYLTLMEHARYCYMVHLGLWKETGSFFDMRVIVADAHIAFLAPAYLNQVVRVSTGVVQLGNKSFRYEYELTDAQTGTVLARGDTVMVAFDYDNHQSISIPEEWRQAIAAFEGIPPR